MRKILKWIRFVWREIILKYLFCYLVAVVMLGVVLQCKIYEPWNSWLISLSASMFSLPVVFVIYNLYSNVLDRKTQKKISDRLKRDVSGIFARYLYFTEFFYYRIEEEFPGDEKSLNLCMNYDEDRIFELVSSNVFSGVFLFSEFDSFGDNIYEMIDDAIVTKYISREEIAVLFDFIESYKELCDIFKIITINEYIVCGYYDNIDIKESTQEKNLQGEKFYEFSWKREDNRFESFFAAMYPIFEKDKMNLKIKLSGNKAKQVAQAIQRTYLCIRKWLSIHGETKISFDNSIVAKGRLYTDFNLTLNQFMENNCTIKSKF